VCAKVGVLGAKPLERHNNRFAKLKTPISLPYKQSV
jgi:hypothetical protein